MSEPKNCPDPKWFARLIDGGLPSEQEAKLIKHLDRCSACQEKVEQYHHSELLANAETDKLTLKSSGTQIPKAMESKLAQVRSQRPSEPSTFNSGYADIQPWLEDVNPNIGRIAEFELVRFIGRGGMGVVFEAHDTKLERAVAIKLMSPGLLADANASDRFLREARSAAKINHTNVVTVHAVDQVRGLPYLVMELVRGPSLEQQLSFKTKLPTIEILKIARQTALGLSAAHENGITHRDIKPSNLMFDKHSKRIRIADFGLASTVNDTSLTRSGMLIGTPDFASPEQVNGQPVDARSDLFSLGSVLFMLCAGKPPFASDSLMQTLDAVRHAAPDFDELNHQSVPQGLIDVIRRLMQKQPENRFQTAEELCQALKRVSVSTRAKNATPVKSIESDATVEPVVVAKQNRKNRKTPLVYAAIGFVVILALLSGVLWLAQTWNMNSEAAQAEDIERGVSIEVQSDALSAPEVASEDSTELVPEFSTIEVSSPSELFDALDEPGNLVIKLAPGETFELDQSIQIASRSVQFVGDPNQPPIMLFAPNSGEATIHLEDGDFMFRNIQIQEGFEAERFENLISCEGGNLEFDNCVLVGRSQEQVIEVHESDLILKSTVLISAATCISVHPKMDQQIQIVDSAILSPTNFLIEHSAEFELVASGSCFAAWSGFEIEADAADQISLDFEVENCEFHFPDAMIVVELDLEELEIDKQDVADELRENVRWRGTSSIVPENLAHISEHDEFISWKDCKIQLDDETEQRNFSEISPSIDQLIEHCLENKIDSVDQIRKLLRTK
ncbi:MAG: serine/threonine-protein kinase [Planctomycetota bacterium]